MTSGVDFLMLTFNVERIASLNEDYYLEKNGHPHFAVNDFICLIKNTHVFVLFSLS